MCYQKIFAGKFFLNLVLYKFSGSCPDENFSTWITKCFYSSSVEKQRWSKLTEWLKLANHMSQIHFWTFFSDASTPQCMKTIVSAIQGSPTNLLSSVVLLSAGSVTQPLAEHVCPSPPLPPFLQHTKSPKCYGVCRSKRERVRMIWGPRSAVGRVASDIAFADLTLCSVSAFPWLFWEHLRDCNHSTGLPCGHMDCVLHRLLMHCMRGGCFA